MSSNKLILVASKVNYVTLLTICIPINKLRSKDRKRVSSKKNKILNAMNDHSKRVRLHRHDVAHSIRTHARLSLDSTRRGNIIPVLGIFF